MSHDDELRSILAALTIVRRPGAFVYVTAPRDSVAGAVATIDEAEGTTFVLEREVAERAGLEWTFAAAWLIVELRTSLEGVGLTAALAAALADAGIPCNVLAGFHHDHLLVPEGRADDAIGALHALRDRS